MVLFWDIRLHVAVVTASFCHRLSALGGRGRQLDVHLSCHGVKCSLAAVLKRNPVLWEWMSPSDKSASRRRELREHLNTGPVGSRGCGFSAAGAELWHTGWCFPETDSFHFSLMFDFNAVVIYKVDSTFEAGKSSSLTNINYKWK